MKELVSLQKYFFLTKAALNYLKSPKLLTVQYFNSIFEYYNRLIRHLNVYNVHSIKYPVLSLIRVQHGVCQIDKTHNEA